MTITKEQIDVVNWQKVGGAWVIRLFTTERKVYRFAGFQDWDRLQLSRSVHYILIVFSLLFLLAVPYFDAIPATSVATSAPMFQGGLPVLGSKCMRLLPQFLPIKENKRAKIC